MSIILYWFFLNKLPLLGAFLVISILLAWHNTRLSVFLLIVSVFVSPKINLFPIPSESVFVRFDDLLILAIFFITLVKLKSNDLAFADSPLDNPILSFIIILVVSIINGVFIRTVSKPLISLLYLLKIIEYFLFFYLVYFYTRSRKDLIYYLGACLLGIAAISIYGIFEHFHPLARLPYPSLYRIYERGFFYGQSNHFGGTLAFFISLLLGLAVFSGSWRLRIALSVIIFGGIFAFFWTYSRQAQLNLAVSLAALGLISLRYVKRNLQWMFPAMLSIIVIAALSSPLVRERILSIKEVISSNDVYSSSFAYRLNIWKMAFADSKGHLLLGTGLGSRHRAFYESQWVMYLCETGIVGTTVYLWLLFRVFRLLFSRFAKTGDNFYKGLTAGCLAGLTGLIVQGFAGNVFTITVIVVPFYIILALILGAERKSAADGVRNS